ncbi:MAG: YgiT-type zinc finger domain-containing protein [Desulfobacteraceae bacterium 4572_88]|nr:MAG: YgiT-type zinc finger domain-containing protein [Desulfobacteraceae bacterium 4572_88]RLC12932.1 MAG: YgiT-type zinc finger domain-containing protein [Deltaproteobacteria bacterium]
MKYLNEKCAVCGGQLLEKEVEKLLRGGRNMASLKVRAEVCSHCGERFYTPQVIEHFEAIEARLEKNDVRDFRAVGQAFQIAS